MNTRYRALERVVLAFLLFVLGVVSTAAPLPAAADPAAGSSAATLGADLGLPTNFAVADTVPACSGGMVSQSEVLQCPGAVQKHQLIFTWRFDQYSCTTQPCSAPDGFNLVRVADGAASTFQTAAGNDRGAILQVTAADVAGSCFYVLPFRGTNDFGRKSNTVCITIQTTIKLAPVSVSQAHAYQHSDGATGKSPDSNPGGYTIAYRQTQSAGPDVTVGFLDRRSVGAFASASSYYDVYQALITFDLTKLPSQNVKKATFTANIKAAAYNRGGSGATYDGSEDTAPRSCAVSLGYPTNYSEGGSVPNVVHVDVQKTFAPELTQTLTLDVTGMVHAWLGARGVNNGLVLTSQYENINDYTAAFYRGTLGSNADCMTLYSEPRLTIELGS